ncbi:MAG: acyltransferase family protein, partial [Polyangiaceae bacterium]
MTLENRGARPELRALTGLRFGAAASVVAFHFVRFRFDPQGILRRIMSCGFTAVGLFFVLSGFILVYAYDGVPHFESPQRRAFFRARFARVYPVYALGMIFGAFVTFALGWAHVSDFTSFRGALRIAAVTCVLTGVSHRTMFVFNWAAWSLTSELLFYVSFPFLIG